MAQMKVWHLSHAQCAEVLNGRTSVRIGHNTWLEKANCDEFVVRLHRTNILVFYPDGDVRISTDGWETVTTKDRLNQLLPIGMRICQVKGEWYINGTPFRDGMLLSELFPQAREVDWRPTETIPEDFYAL